MASFTLAEKQAILKRIKRETDLDRVSRELNVPKITLKLWHEDREAILAKKLTAKQVFWDAIAKSRLIEARHMISFCQKNFDLKTRMCQYWIKEAQDCGRIKPVRRRLYVNARSKEPVTLSEVAQHMYPSSNISLDKIFDASVKVDPSETMIILPYNPADPGDRPKTGKMETEMGVINVFGVSGDVAESVRCGGYLNPSYQYFKASLIEKSIADAYHCAHAKGRAYRAPENVRFSEPLLPKRMLLVSKATGIDYERLHDFITQIKGNQAFRKNREAKTRLKNNPTM